jgi:hypothetical protein
MTHKGDDPIFCRRCIRGEAWEDEEICRTCKGELEAAADWRIGWRVLWEQEKEARRRTPADHTGSTKTDQG